MSNDAFNTTKCPKCQASVYKYRPRVIYKDVVECRKCGQIRILSDELVEKLNLNRARALPSKQLPRTPSSLG